MDEFLKKQFNTDELWRPLRDNYKDEKNFVKACIAKVDGLRILQFLKINQQPIKQGKSCVLTDYLYKYHSKGVDGELNKALENFDLENSPTEQLSKIRDFLFKEEMALRKVR